MKRLEPPLRAAIALLAAGGLVLGLSACGGSSSSTIKKQAGFGVLGSKLTVTNRLPTSITLRICNSTQFGNDCKPDQDLRPHQSGDMAVGSGNAVTGTITFPDGDEVSIKGFNNGIGQPIVRVDETVVPLAEGESRNVTIGGIPVIFTASRAADLDDYKDLRLEVKPSG